MPANTAPITPRIAKGVGFKITAAQTDQTGNTGANIVTGYTFTATGTPPADGQGGQWLNYRIRVPVTSAIAVVNLYRNTGGTRYLIASFAVTAVTVNAQTGGADSGVIALPPVYMLPGDKIDGSSTIAQETHVDLEVAEY